VNKNLKKVQCKFCDKIFFGGIFHLKNRLACTRKDVEPCVSVLDDVKKEVLTILMKNVEVIERKRKIIHGIHYSDNEDDQVQHVISKENGKSTGLDVFFENGEVCKCN